MTPTLGRLYRVDNNNIMIRTSSAYGSDDEVELRLYYDIDRRQDCYTRTSIRWQFKDWSYDIQYCLNNKDFSGKLSNVPEAVNKTWIITTSPGKLNMTCNGVPVLQYLYYDAELEDCLEDVEYRNIPIRYVRVYNSNTKMELNYGSKYITRYQSAPHKSRLS